MKHLDERLLASQDASLRKFGVLKEHMLLFQDALKSEQVNRDALKEAKDEEILKIDAALKATLESEQDARKEAE